jgi:hypothetical protein
MREAIEEQLVKSLPRFTMKGSTVPWQERSILMSEAFAFCGIGDLFDVDIVFESGIWLGRSTEIFAKYFAPKKVIAVDVNLKKAAVERLREYKNLSLIQGEGPEYIESFIKDSTVKRAGIFIDGPKESRAVDCAEALLKLKNVSFVAVHDAHKSKVKRMLLGLNRPLFFTCEKWFLEKYSKLDKGESQWDEGQGLKWIPYHLISKDNKVVRDYESYGATIGFVLKGLK